MANTIARRLLRRFAVVSASLMPCVVCAMPEGHIDPAIGTRTPVSDRARKLQDAGLIAVHVYTEPKHLRAIERSISAMPTPKIVRTLRATSDGVLILETTVKDAKRIATLPGVRWVEQAPEPTLRNGSLRSIVHTGSTTGSDPFDIAGLTGSGQIVGVIDDPLDWDHCAFDDANPIGDSHRKILAYNAPFAGVSAHGTHVCGTLAGDSEASGDLRGVATGARLVFNTIPAFDESTFAERLSIHAGQGAAIHSNSWGDEQSTAYGGLARAIDAFCWEHDEQLVVIATSNEPVLKTPENAKNALAVSATLDAPFQDRFCVGAVGPTLDGRRKPDLVAPGCSIFSAYPFGAGCPTGFSSGTSMATPAVAGAAAIARQYFIEGWYPQGEPIESNGFTPSGALLKAVLIAGAVDLSDEPGWPSSREGWGRVMLAGCLPIGSSTPSRLLIEQRWNNDNGSRPAVAHGAEQRVLFNVDNPAEPLRIVLAWHDAPGEFGTTDPVINNLDLSIIAPDGTVYLGNEIDETTGQSRPASSPGAASDSRNTVEVVAIASPIQGTYTARILGAEVSMGTQGYGLAVVGDIEPAIVTACGPADVAEPFGVLDLADITEFLGEFGSRSPDADLTEDGIFDLSDINMFIAAFIAGCG